MSSNNNTTVHLVVSWAPLLSGALDECFSADDETCQGGVAAVGAFLRHYSRQQQQQPSPEPSLVLPFLDKQSAFVQMHELGWSVNRLVLHHIMGWNVFGAAPSLLTQNSVDLNVSQTDISALQSTEMPLLLTNVAVPSGNSWHPYTVPIYFDETTGLAVMLVYNSNQPMNADQVESVVGSLNYIKRRNVESGCDMIAANTTSPGSQYTLFDKFVNATKNSSSSSWICWAPVVLYADVRDRFATFLQQVSEHDYPPALVVDLEGEIPEYREPQLVGSKGAVWVVSHAQAANMYIHHEIELNTNDDATNGGHRRFEQVSLILEDLSSLNASLKDEQYVRDVAALREQADQAFENNPVVGRSEFMPLTREGNYRRCKAGECEIGNLFTDAARWWANTDIAFSGSGGFRGPGWDAGDVRVSNIWEALPFPNNMCSGTLTGISLFNLVKYSVNAATFEGENTSNGDRLLQVSGMRVTYNTQLKPSRLVQIEIWDKERDQFLPVERLKLYRFVTDSYMCSGFDPYPSLLGESLILPGEEPGVVLDGILFQTIVGNYLGQLESPYVPAIEGRLVNNTDAAELLDVNQESDSCPPGTYWKEEVLTCETCPVTTNVAFLRATMEFEGQIGNHTKDSGVIDMVNGAPFGVAVVPKARPSWLSFSKAKIASSDEVELIVDGRPTTLESSDRMSLLVEVDHTGLGPGTAQGTVTFGVLDGGNYPGCTEQDVSFEARLRVLDEQELNQLGDLRYIGWTLAGITCFVSLYFSAWVILNRNSRMVKTLQPSFLVTICVGLMIMALTMVPLGIDDEIASQRGCDIACMSIPWLLSIGFTVSMSALFSKLWRINQLFRNAGRRRMRVTGKDVIAPFAVLFSLNSVLMLVWTLVDPIKWARNEAEEPWNTYGSCRFLKDKGADGKIMMILVAALNILALFVATFQAYLARKIADEFSESKRIGVALFCWCQLFLIGGPVLFLIDNDNPDAKYFIHVILLFLVSMSMLLVIFVPLLTQQNLSTTTNGEQQGEQRGPHSASRFSIEQVGTTRVSGLNFSHLSTELSNELAKLPYHEHVPTISSNTDTTKEELEQRPAFSSVNSSFPAMQSLPEEDRLEQETSTPHEQRIDDCQSQVIYQTDRL